MDAFRARQEAATSELLNKQAADSRKREMCVFPVEAHESCSPEEFERVAVVSLLSYE